MRLLACMLVMALIATGILAADEKERTLQVTKDDLGKLPANWTATKTGTGQGSLWKVVADETAPSRSGHAMAQLAESPGAVFNLCIASDINYKDVAMTVAFKAVKGKG